MKKPTWNMKTETTSSGKALFECSGCGEQGPYPDKHECRLKRLKLDPNLTDGNSHAIHDDVDASLMDLIRVWMSEAQEGDAITLELVRMTDRETEELPDL